MFKDTKLFNVKFLISALLKKLICVLCGSKGNTVKRGVVFINETIPYPMWLGWLINYITNITLWCLQNTKLVMKAQQKSKF
jgi:hypothetical protein